MRTDRNADGKGICEATCTGTKSEVYYWTDKAAS
jgi:hypothetical protein